MLSDDALLQAAEVVNRNEIRRAYKTFRWQNDGLPAAWNVRKEMEVNTQQWLASKRADGGRALATAVHKWGFGKISLPRSCRVGQWEGTFYQVMRAWHLKDGVTSAPTANQLVELLAGDRVGIATVSKWICFIDQERYAIYDSRVSRALRTVQVGGARLFPIVPGRVATGKWARGDLLGSDADARHQAVRAYVQYLRLVRMLGMEVGLIAGQVEMALFMLGKELPSTSERRLPFARHLYTSGRIEPHTCASA